MRDRQPPALDLDTDENGHVNISPTGDWADLLKASGAVAVAAELMSQVAQLASQGRQTDKDASDFALAYVDAMKPRDPAEVLLLTQMAATHQATMMLARRLNHVETLAQQDAAERALNKLARTYAAQMETLKKYRSKGQQVVRVERVNVESGGQAVVGAVETGGRGNAEK
jgi:anion-transporting  ArsA/GET3 family ATPase